MSAPIIADAAERARAIDPSGSFIVQAPAGSGKTELLIQRFLALLGTVSRPDEILAITFTRKAAGEMRARLLQALQAAAGPEPESEHARLTWKLACLALERDRSRGWNLAENPSLLSIQTIDSFNASLVRRMPWISRFGAMPEVSDDPASLYREAAERTLARLGSEKAGASETARLLTHLDGRMDLLRDLLVRMLGRRDQWLRHLGEKDHDLWRRNLEDALRGFVEGKLMEAEAAVPVDLKSELCALGRYAAANLSGSERPLMLLAECRAFPDAGASDLLLWRGLADLLLTSSGTLRKPKGVNKKCGFPAGKGEAAAMKERMAEALEGLSLRPETERLFAEALRLPDAAYPEEQWRILEALVELLPLAAAELWLVFRQQGKTDFAAIAMRATESLGSSGAPSDLLLRLDARISHILLDEFQDTSYLQSGLVEHLTSEWSAGDGRTLFVVGDPMQSIYLFREAEVGLFLRARSRGIGSVALEALTLCSNFRSQRGIVDWVNDSFAGVFPDGEDEALGGVVYSQATAVHPPIDEPACTVHPFDERDDRAEALQVADLAARALQERPEETVAVLVRGRTHLPEILRAFRERGLRYAAKDIDLLECRPAVRDILALTRALLHSADRLCWLSVLRAPWCGLTLADLHALCGSESSRTVPGLLADGAVLGRLSEDGRKRAERVRGILRRGIDRRGAIGLRLLVEGCWLALGGPACVDEAGSEDAAMVFSLMERLDHGGDLQSLDALEEGVRRLFAAPDAEADGRLQVMTIHKSKGLEFDTVILPGLGRLPAGGDRELLRWLEHPDFGLLLAPVAPRDGIGKDPIYETIGRLEKQKEELESTRLLYVAATRAKKRLHLLGHAKLSAKGECAPAAGSLLKKLWPSVEGSFRFSPEQEEVIAEEAKRGGHPIRRLPADWSLPELVPAPVSRAAAVESPSERKGEESREGLFSGWEAETARHVGTVAHAYLERIAMEGLGRWPAERVEKEEEVVRRRLNALGVPASELPAGGRKVLDSLVKTLGSERGRWILGEREEGQCEMKLSGLLEGGLVHSSIDRTFVADGFRWIIDYKTSDCRGAAREEFLNEQAQKYSGQLQAYAELFRSLEPGREIRTALYFPLFDGWWEVGTGSSRVE